MKNPFEKFLRNKKGGAKEDAPKKETAEDEMKKREKEAEELLGGEALDKYDEETKKIEDENWWGGEDAEITEKDIDMICDIFEGNMENYEEKMAYLAMPETIENNFTDYFNGLLRKLGKGVEIGKGDLSCEAHSESGSGEPEMVGEIKLKGVDVAYFDMSNDYSGIKITVDKPALKKALEKLFKAE